MKDWRKAELKDLNTFRVIEGRLYKGVAEAITVGRGEYETQVRWHLATWKEAARFNRQAQ